MLTKKLLAAVGLASALLIGVAGSAEARGWGGGGRFHRGPVYGGPVYVAPPAYDPGYGGGWRRDEWRRDEWRRAEWRREHHRFGRFGRRY